MTVKEANKKKTKKKNMCEKIIKTMRIKMFLERHRVKHICQTIQGFGVKDKGERDEHKKIFFPEVRTFVYMCM